MYCKYCGTRNKDGSRFCMGCGKALEASASEGASEGVKKVSLASSGTGIEQKMHKAKVKIWIAIACSMAVVVVCIGIFTFLYMKGNEKADWDMASENDRKADTDTDADYGEGYEEQEAVQEKPRYTWKVAPRIEADDIYYVTCTDSYNYSLNELYRQYKSRYAVIRRGDVLGLIDMDGNINGEMKYRSIESYLGMYLLESFESEYIEDYEDVYDLYLADEDGMIDILEGIEVTRSDHGFYYMGRLEQAGMEESDEITLPDQAFPVRRSSIIYYDTDMTPGPLLWWTTELKGKYAVYNKNRFVSDFIYDECGSCSDGLLAVCVNGKWGYIDSNGETVIPIEFDASWKGFLPYESIVIDDPKPKEYCYAASGGYVALRKGNNWELRDVSGETVILPGTFDEMRPVYDGMCWVKKDGKWGVIEIAEE